nr:DUF2987 domain-containing protein [Motilimonas eburnea]
MVNLVRNLLILFVFLCTPWASAQESTFAYSDFYKRLAVVKKEGLTRVSPAFFLLDKHGQQPCEVTKAVIETAERHVTVLQKPTGELLIPYDAKLKQDKADLILGLRRDQQDCTMSLQTKLMVPIESVDRVDGLKKIADELEKLMLGQAGFWGKLFLPDFNGITLTLSDALIDHLASQGQSRYTLVNTDFEVEQGQIHISKQWLAEHIGMPISLTDGVVDIKPWLVQ